MFEENYKFGQELLKANLILPALEQCLKCSHLFNLLDSSGSVGVTERMAYILRVRQLALAICKAYVDPDGNREPGAGSREAGAANREPGAGSREPGSRKSGTGAESNG